MPTTQLYANNHAGRALQDLEKLGGSTASPARPEVLRAAAEASPELEAFGPDDTYTDMTQRRPTNPEYVGFREQGHVLDSIRRPVISGDGFAAMQRNRAFAVQRTANIAAMNQFGNGQRVQFNAYDPISFPTYPMEMKRRGVPREMFEADIKILRELATDDQKKASAKLRLCLLTCGVSEIVTLPMPSLTERYQRKLQNRFADMNPRYDAYDISWSQSFTPFGGGHYIIYET